MIRLATIVEAAEEKEWKNKYIAKVTSKAAEVTMVTTEEWQVSKGHVNLKSIGKENHKERFNSFWEKPHLMYNISNLSGYLSKNFLPLPHFFVMKIFNH